MRPGLIVVGLALAVVGAAVIVGLLDPGNNPTVERDGSADVVDLTANSWRTFVLPAEASDAATLSLSWSASGPVNVSWYPVYSCSTPPGTCNGPALKLWIANVSGHWSASGRTGALYGLYVLAVGGHAVEVNFSGTFTERYHTGQLTLPMVPFVVTLVGGSLLAGIGGVALYLGVFLPAGVYAPFEQAPESGPAPWSEEPGRPPPEKPDPPD